jgi:hypothetical protein
LFDGIVKAFDSIGDGNPKPEMLGDQKSTLKSVIE